MTRYLEQPNNWNNEGTMGDGDLESKPRGVCGVLIIDRFNKQKRIRRRMVMGVVRWLRQVEASTILTISKKCGDEADE